MDTLEGHEWTTEEWCKLLYPEKDVIVSMPKVGDIVTFAGMKYKISCIIHDAFMFEPLEENANVQ